MVPFQDLPVDAFTLYPSFTFPASMTRERRFLNNDRFNALRQSLLYLFRARVANTTFPESSGQQSFNGTIRAVPGSWLFAVSGTAGPNARWWDSSNRAWTQGIPINGPRVFSTLRNGNTGGIYIPLAEPWFLPDGVINWEIHNPSVSFTFYFAEPRAEIRGEVLSACMDKRLVEF